MIDREVADTLPRRNGELVFEAPWESRAFGMAVVMHEKGVYQWNDFRDRLIEEVSTGSARYYESWLTAFETVLVARGMIEPSELEARVADFKELRRDPAL